MSRAREFADLAGSADAGGITGKNMVTNGSMAVAQRGTSSTGQTSGGYKTCDRWRVSITTQGTWTISQSSTTPNGEFSSSLKFDCTTADASPAASDQVAVETRLEAQDVAHLGYGNSDAKAITVSFWVRSNKTGTYTFEVFAQDPNRLNSTTYTIDSANTWEKKEITIPADTSGSGINSDSGIGLIVKWWLGAGSTFTGGTFTNNVWEANVNANRVHSSQVNLADSTSNEWYITGVQLELGEQATPFEHEDFGTTLAKCQRYFNNFTSGNAQNTIFPGRSTGTTQVDFAVSLGTPLRNTPSIVNSTAVAYAYGGSSRSTSSGGATTVSQFDSGSSIITLRQTGFSVTDDRVYNIGLFANVTLDAEL